MANRANIEGHPSGLEWHAESMRLTGILPGTEVEAAALWQQVVGEEPGTTTRQKGISQRAEGAYRDRRLSLVVRPERTEWVLSPSEPPGEEVSPTFRTIGMLPECLEIIREIADRWTKLDTCSPHQRIALGAILMSPVEDVQAGYRAVGGLLPSVSLDASNSSDFFYQINRPREKSVAGFDIKVNRLMTWSVVKMMVRTMVLAAPRAPAPSGPVACACRLQLDINSDADFPGNLDREQMRELFALFAEYAVEISREGDKP